MNWLTSPILRPSRQQILALARDVAQQSVEDVRSKLSPQAAAMSLAEAREYIRARSGGEVARHAGRAIVARCLPPSIEHELTHEARECVVQLLIREMLVLPIETSVLEDAA